MPYGIAFFARAIASFGRLRAIALGRICHGELRFTLSKRYLMEMLVRFRDHCLLLARESVGEVGGCGGRDRGVSKCFEPAVALPGSWGGAS